MLDLWMRALLGHSQMLTKSMVVKEIGAHILLIKLRVMFSISSFTTTQPQPMASTQEYTSHFFISAKNIIARLLWSVMKQAPSLFSFIYLFYKLNM